MMKMGKPNDAFMNSPCVERHCQSQSERCHRDRGRPTDAGWQVHVRAAGYGDPDRGEGETHFIISAQ